jgi:hypothetical protein
MNTVLKIQIERMNYLKLVKLRLKANILIMRRSMEEVETNKI